jgi:hypothetical protein
MSELCQDPVTCDWALSIRKEARHPKDTTTEYPSSRVGAAKISIALVGAKTESRRQDEKALLAGHH